MRKNSKKRSGKNKSYIVVREGACTKRPSPPGKSTEREHSDSERTSDNENISDNEEGITNGRGI